ncbi:hypothetical protein CEXT_161451 [Caerostris extrusa]|uniref:Uncharacterized protein n=1 Tax=Caerostris extrusa TaxID=172846 RepID=A0AAV4WPN4_CAEEX|nr:hypothetical protein CEXT_161451 [Caerostris extrusa]
MFSGEEGAIASEDQCRRKEHNQCKIIKICCRPHNNTYIAFILWDSSMMVTSPYCIVSLKHLLIIVIELMWGCLQVVILNIRFVGLLNLSEQGGLCKYFRHSTSDYCYFCTEEQAKLDRRRSAAKFEKDVAEMRNLLNIVGGRSGF